MPVLLDRGNHGCTVLGAQREIPASNFRPTNSIELVLVNNMPDSALEATERQFAELLAAASRDMLIRVRLFALPELPRNESARRYLRETYSTFDRLWSSRPDGLIVTGTEPRAKALTDEPYWSTLTQIVDWAQYATKSAIWSCLAAHAAILHVDGIHRRPLREKRSGVFECTRTADHPIVAAMPRRFRIPHSRCNGLDQNELIAGGYTILSNSAHAGVDSFTKRIGSAFVFFQGHPEYDAGTLLREYRRDVGRFVRGEREAYPSMPEGYFAPEATSELMMFRERALTAKSDTLMSDFPAVEHNITNTWRSAATSIYRNWLLSLVAQEAGRPTQKTHMASRTAFYPTMPARTELAATDGNGLLRLGLSPVAAARASRAPMRSRIAAKPPVGGTKA
jgi:homoserine O-succinyltransferase